MKPSNKLQAVVEKGLQLFAYILLLSPMLFFCGFILWGVHWALIESAKYDYVDRCETKQVVELISSSCGSRFCSDQIYVYKLTDGTYYESYKLFNPDTRFDVCEKIQITVTPHL